MNENLIPECREFTMIEELWPIKKYEGNRPVWDCREWLVEALQGEILDHVRRYNHPYVLMLSEEPIWTEVAYKNRRDTMYTLDMQKLSPLEIGMIVTPFIKKCYNVYQDEKAKCIKISRKEIPGLKSLEIPEIPGVYEREKLSASQLRQLELKTAKDYLMKMEMQEPITIEVEELEDSEIINVSTSVEGETVTLKLETKSLYPHLYIATTTIDKSLAEKTMFKDGKIGPMYVHTAHEAFSGLYSTLSELRRRLKSYEAKNRNDHDR